MDLQEVIARGQDAVTVARVYGPPLEKDGITIIPAAAVRGGGGGGGGENDDPPNKGFGTGFGIMGRPVGAFVIQDGTVRWQPAIDPTRYITLAIVGLFVLRSLIKTRTRSKRRLAKIER